LKRKIIYLGYAHDRNTTELMKAKMNHASS